MTSKKNGDRVRLDDLLHRVSDVQYFVTKLIDEQENERALAARRGDDKYVFVRDMVLVNLRYCRELIEGIFVDL